MKAFNIDFNWSQHADGHLGPALPGTFHQADPRKIVDWYKWIGADCFWNFATSYNGYAWYESAFAPRTPGLACDFLDETTRLGQEAGMTVFAYVCVSANAWWEQLHPETVRPEVGSMRIVPTEAYLTHLTNVLVEAANHSPFDGFALDWFRHPNEAQQVWAESEKALYKQLMGERFPSTGILPDQASIDTYHKLMIEHMWAFIKSGLSQVRPLQIWANEPFWHGEEAVWTNNKFLADIDYTLNESADLSLIPIIKGFAPQIKVIQNICGWPDHDLAQMQLDAYDFDGLFGFAQADEQTCLPETNANSAVKMDIMDVNYKNILNIQKLYTR